MAETTTIIVSENEMRKQENKIIDEILNKTNAKITLYILWAIRVAISFAMIVAIFTQDFGEYGLIIAIVAVIRLVLSMCRMRLFLFCVQNPSKKQSKVIIE